MTVGQFARRWLPVIVLAVAALALWQTAERRDTDVVATEPIPYELELATPMLSARRVPETLQAPVVDAKLAPALRAMINDSPTNSCLQVQVDGRIIEPTLRPRIQLVPASNQKVLTTYAAHLALGSDFRFTTRVVANTEASGGVLDGNLYLIGSGDPFLSTEDWWTQYEVTDGRFHTRLEDLADAVAATGIVEVTGTIVGDESLFDAERQGTWAERLINSKQSGPLSALSVNEGFAAWPEEFVAARLRTETDDPPLHAVSELNQLLAERGVIVAQPPTTGTAPASQVPVAEVSSPPLRDLLTHINAYSSNFGAELLLKRIGVEVRQDGSSQAGAAALEELLEQSGIPVGGLVVVDGSGLAETNRVTCEAVAAVLASGGPGSDADLRSTMAIGGELGTLRLRMVDTAAEGSVFAKTGSLLGSSALSGYVNSRTDDDTYLVFAYIANADDIDIEAVTGLQDSFAATLTGYPAPPTIAELSPLAPNPS